MDSVTLWEEFNSGENPNAREEIICHHLPYAKTIALAVYKYWISSEILFEDFLQYATVGLIEAVDNFDYKKGYPFEVFAKLRIRGAILNSISHYSENLSYTSYRRKIEKERFESIEKFASSKRLDEFRALVQVTASSAISHLLDGLSLWELEEEEIFKDNSIYGQPPEAAFYGEVLTALENVTERNKAVLKLHYMDGFSFTEIAKSLSLSKASISNAHASGLLELREKCCEDNLNIII